MPTNTKLSIKSASYLDDKKTVTDTINYVNPNLDDATALELAQRFNALTLNSYKSTEKITTTELDASATKPQRVFRANGPSLLYIDNGNKYINLNQTSEITLPKSQVPVSNNCFSLQIYAQTQLDTLMEINDIQAEGYWQATNYQYQNPKGASVNHQWRIVIEGPNAIDTGTVSFTIHFDETDEFAAFNLPVTITITEG